MISIFLAGSSSDLARVRKYAAKLDAANIHIVDRWFDDAHLWAGRDAEKSAFEQRAIASSHARSISKAHAVWWLFKPVASGSWMEAGIAAAQRKPLYVSGHGCTSTVYTSLATFRDPCDDYVLCEVLRAAKEAGR